VRCKDCKYWQDNNGGYPHEECRWGKDETPDDDDYCSYGERNDMNEHDATELAFKNGYKKGARDVLDEVEKNILSIKVDSTNLDITYGAFLAIHNYVAHALAELKKKYGGMTNESEHT
jgi:hypothetical protein